MEGNSNSNASTDYVTGELYILYNGRSNGIRVIYQGFETPDYIFYTYDNGTEIRVPMGRITPGRNEGGWFIESDYSSNSNNNSNSTYMSNNNKSSVNSNGTIETLPVKRPRYSSRKSKKARKSKKSRKTRARK
jgi:hypothetical protein